MRKSVWQAEAEVSKREALKGLFAASVAFATVAQPVQAGLLGISTKEEKDEEYKTFTVCCSPVCN